MEDKIGYVVISTGEYKELIKNDIYNKSKIDDLNNEMLKIIKKITKYIRNDSEFEIDKLETGEDGKVKETYYYDQLVDFFNKLGIEDKEFIGTTIKEFYENREK